MQSYTRSISIPEAQAERAQFLKKILALKLITFPELDGKKEVPFDAAQPNHLRYLYRLLVSQQRPRASSRCFLIKQDLYHIPIPKLKWMPASVAGTSVSIRLHKDILFLKPSAQFPHARYMVIGDWMKTGNTHQIYYVDVKITLGKKSRSSLNFTSFDSLILKKRLDKKFPVSLISNVEKGCKEESPSFDQTSLSNLCDTLLFQDSDEAYLIMRGKPGIDLEEIDFHSSSWTAENRLFLILEICGAVRRLPQIAASSVFTRFPLQGKKILWHSEQFKTRFKARLEGPDISMSSVCLLAHTWRIDEKPSNGRVLSEADDIIALTAIYKKILTDASGKISVPYWLEDANAEALQKEINDFLTRCDNPIERPDLLQIENFFTDIFFRCTVSNFPRGLLADKEAYQKNADDVRFLINGSFHDKHLHAELVAIHHRIIGPQDAKTKMHKPPTFGEVKSVLATVPERRKTYAHLWDKLNKLSKIKSARSQEIKKFLGNPLKREWSLEEMAAFLDESQWGIFEEKVTCLLEQLLNVMSEAHSDDVIKPLKTLCCEEKDRKKATLDSIQKATGEVLNATKLSNTSLLLKKSITPLCEQLRDFPLDYKESDINEVRASMIVMHDRYQNFNRALNEFFTILSGDQFEDSNSTGISKMIETNDEKSKLRNLEKLFALLAVAKSRRTGFSNWYGRQHFFGKGRHPNVGILYFKIDKELRKATASSSNVTDLLQKATETLIEINKFMADKNNVFVHGKRAPESHEAKNSARLA